MHQASNFLSSPSPYKFPLFRKRPDGARGFTCFESISAKSINFVLMFAVRALPGKYNLLEKIAYLPP
jgi:hypothetical protein